MPIWVQWAIGIAAILNSLGVIGFLAWVVRSLIAYALQIKSLEQRMQDTENRCMRRETERKEELDRIYARLDSHSQILAAIAQKVGVAPNDFK